MSTAMSSREFNQRTSAAKRAADQGPVIVTDRGRPRHVLLSYSDFAQMTGPGQSAADFFASLPDSSNIDLPLPRRRVEPPRPVDFG